MYTYEEIKPQNKQDAFAAMYLRLAESLLEFCGRGVGEGIVREAVRRAGRKSGEAQRRRLLAGGLKTNIQNFYRYDPDAAEDPRFRTETLFDEEERQVWEVYTCPLADYWNRRGGGKLGSFYCEEYQYARVTAFTDGVGQVNLSKNLTCPRDNFCRFSVYFREANMPPERAKEAFARRDPAYRAPDAPNAGASLDESVNRMTVSVYYHLLEAAEDRCGRVGVCAVSEGLKRWAADALKALRVQAEHTLLPMDGEFVRLNFPLSLDPGADAAWGEHGGRSAPELMKKLVLDPLASGLDD